MKKILSLCLLISLLFGVCVTATSCGAYSDEEAAVFIDELLTKEAELNGYIYKDSFKTAEDPGEDVNSPYQQYYRVAPDSKYLTLGALRDAVDEILSETSRDEIYAYAFDGVHTEEYSAPPRFSADKEGNLEINVSDPANSGMRTVALLGSARVKRSTQGHIRAVITVERTKADGTVVRDDEKVVEIRYENGAWRLVNQTMIVGVK